MDVMLASVHYTAERDHLASPASTLSIGITGMFLSAWFM